MDFSAEKRKSKVRISKGLSEGEVASIASRRKEMKKWFDKMGIQCDLDQIPNIAVLGSGGGLRAMIALYGTLVELKKLDLLDCIMYLCGVSGSTWCMSAIYKNEDWSDKIDELLKNQCENLLSDKWELNTAVNAAVEACSDESYSLTDFWSYFIVYKLLNEIDESKLSDHRKSCENGKNPYPLYAAVDKHTYIGYQPGSWFEFTPHEVGIVGIGGKLDLGAFINTRYFGSIFNNGQRNVKKEEKSISYLQGLWGSALGSEEEIKKTVTETLLNYLDWGDSSYGSHYSEGEEAHFSCEEEIYAENLSILAEAYQHILHLKLCEDDDVATEADTYFDLLDSLLKTKGGEKSNECLREVRQEWSSADRKKRQQLLLNLWEALDEDIDLPEEIEEAFSQSADTKTEGSYSAAFSSHGTCSMEQFTPQDLTDSSQVCLQEVFEEQVVPTNGEARRLEAGYLKSIFSLSTWKNAYGWIKLIRKTRICMTHWTWGSVNNFLYNLSDEKVPENKREEFLSVIDAGLAINSAYPLVLHPDRKVKLILSFDFSAGDPFETIKRAAAYCKTHELNFPEIHESEFPRGHNISDCYIFRGDGITVMHIPLFNKINCEDKVDEYSSSFSTFKMNYSSEQIDKLLSAAKKNVANVKEQILEEIRHIV